MSLTPPSIWWPQYSMYRMQERCQLKTSSECHGADNIDQHCFCKNLYSSQNIAWLCETYVLSANEKLHENTDISTRSYMPAIIEEIIDAEPNRYLIMMLSNCESLIECKKMVLSELGFTPRDKGEYRHYKKFSNAAQKLIEESIGFFEAPCCKLFEQLEKQGFIGDHVTYP